MPAATDGLWITEYPSGAYGAFAMPLHLRLAARWRQGTPGSGCYPRQVLAGSRPGETHDGLLARARSPSHLPSLTSTGQRRALELDHPPQPARHARLLSLLALELVYEPDHARRWALADEAVALAREAGDAGTLAAVLSNTFYAYWAPDTLAKRAEHVRELNALVPELQDPHLEGLARIWETHVAIELGEFARADAALERVQAIAEQTRQPTHRWRATNIAGSLTCTQGGLEAAERLAEQALQIGQDAGEPDAAMFYGATIGTIRFYQSRAAEVIALIEQTAAN
jgi:hypothetical protein